jgi:hypothetical protein
MIEKHTWSITAAGRSLAVDAARNEPSHIHVPRPSRVLHRDDAAHRALADTRPWSKLENDEGESEGDRTTALALVDLPAA